MPRMTAQQKAQTIIDRRAAGEVDADIIVSDPKLVDGYKWLKEQDEKIGGARLKPQASSETDQQPAHHTIGDAPPKPKPRGSGAPADIFVPSFGKG